MANDLENSLLPPPAAAGPGSELRVVSSCVTGTGSHCCDDDDAAEATSGNTPYSSTKARTCSIALSVIALK